MKKLIYRTFCCALVCVLGFILPQSAVGQKSASISSHKSELDRSSKDLKDRSAIRSSRVDSLVLSYYDLDQGAFTFSVDRDFDGINQTPPDSGFILGPNIFDDKAKAIAFVVPDSVTDWAVVEVGMVFSYLRPDISNETIDVLIMNGTVDNGPSGTPLYSQTFNLSDSGGDIFDHSPNERDGEFTLVTLDQTVPTDRLIFVVVDFATINTDYGIFGIAASDRQGQRIPELWEQFGNDTWANISDEWFSSTDGIYPWIDVTIISNTVTSSARDLPEGLVSFESYPNPSAGQVQFELNLEQGSSVEIEVFDLMGRSVKVVSDTFYPSGRSTLGANLTELGPGRYFARLTSDKGSSIIPVTLSQ